MISSHVGAPDSPVLSFQTSTAPADADQQTSTEEDSKDYSAAQAIVFSEAYYTSNRVHIRVEKVQAQSGPNPANSPLLGL